MNFPKIIKFVAWCLCFSLGASGCAEMGELQKPAASPYYGALRPATNNEFRWANGDLPKTFDPALARTTSETQAVRQVFDGLTEWDQKTLEAVPALAARWETSEDFRTWTFYLRSAIWSNGKPITAEDFVCSWRRLKNLGKNSANQSLISNIVGAQISDFDNSINKNVDEIVETQLPSDAVASENVVPPENPKSKVQNPNWFGVEALNKQILRVYLNLPDKDFPKLAAHSALRPISHNKIESGRIEFEKEFERPEFAPQLVTSGAFRISSYDQTGVLLERNKNYWNIAQVKPERVRLVATRDAETALAAYQAGSVDAVTNAHIEPLALKLLTSYSDFRRTTYNAVTFYEFNRTRPPFDDHRVRAALAIALDRSRLTGDELDGATFPALNFLPNSAEEKFQFDTKRAQTLFASAGFADAKDFPKIKLLINRNDASQRVAKGVAAQWKKNLNVETEIIVSSLDELENSESTKDFDVIRRVVVLPTTNATANLREMFTKPENLGLESDKIKTDPSTAPAAAANASPVPNEFPKTVPTTIEPIEDAPQIAATPSPQQIDPLILPNQSAADNKTENPPANQIDERPAGETDLTQITPPPVLSESEIINDIPAIPLYFSSSYLLIKPYILGFEANLLDAPLLKEVEINRDWQPPANTIK